MECTASYGLDKPLELSEFQQQFTDSNNNNNYY